MKTVQSILMAAGLASVASAHMEMTFPAPFKSKNNPHAGQDIDYSLVDPIKGAQFPCKGYHSLFGTPAGATTADFTAGSSYKIEIAGGAKHDGGSCQASLSYDKGSTWTVIHSYVGNCPIETSLPFTVPADAPAGEAIFAWTWFNKVGNRELYMNCAAVNIAGGGAAKRQASVPFSSRPAMFVANVDDTCTVPEGTDVEFPNPGPDVTVAPNAKTGAPVGSCGPAAAPVAPPTEPVTPPTEPVTPPTEPVTPPTEPETPPTEPETPPTDPGNIFITAPGVPAPTDVPAPTMPAPSTMMTLSKSADTPKPTAPSTPVAPVTPPATGAGAFAAGTACTAEGDWNCIAGTEFQRCAAGAWSVAQPMAAGLKCTPGQSANLTYAKRSIRGASWF